MKKMSQTSEIVNVAKINTTDFVQSRKGEYRAIIKVQAGFMTVVDDLGIQAKWGKQQWNAAIDVFRNFKRGALQSIQFKAEGSDSWLTVFARTGNKIKLADETLLAAMTVGDINQDWFKTNLYNQYQYQAVGAKTWADKAFVKNS
jgi:putative heme degradation protein